MPVRVTPTYHSTHPTRTGRGGFVAPFLLVILPVLLAAYALAVQTASLRHRQLQLQTSADAAALAAAACLMPADDSLLSAATPDAEKTVRGRILEQARQAAAHYAKQNPVLAKQVLLRDEELLIGVRKWKSDTARDEQLQTADLARPEGQPDAVRIAVTRQNVGARATAFVDHFVVGFKVQGSSHRLTPGGPAAIPVLPLALRRDDWERDVVRRKGRDRFAIDPRFGRPVTSEEGEPDGIPEVTLFFPTQEGKKGKNDKDSKEPQRSGLMLGVGGGSASDVAAQVETGIRHQDLASQPVPGQLLLSYDAQQRGHRLRLPEVKASQEEMSGLVSALNDLRGLRRVWMVYSEGKDGVVIDGFVAARVLEVERTAGGVQVVLQPTLLITATALTAPPGRASPPGPWNPYIAKVRLLR